MRFDLTDLRLFLHIEEAGSITRGAARANLSLASASGRLRGMEDASGVPLFDRTPRGVRPTPAGRALVHHARLVLGQLEQMRGELRQYATGLRGHVRVLSNTAALTEFLPDLFATFLAAYPTIDIDVEERTSRDIVIALAGGLADLGIVADSVDLGALETRPFRIDRLVLVVSATHPFASRPAVAFREALDEPFVGLGHGSALQAYLAEQAAHAGRPLKFRVRVSGMEAVCRLVESGIGVAIVSELTARRFEAAAAIRSVALTDSWAVRRLTICTRETAALPAHAQQFIRHLTETSA